MAPSQNSGNSTVNATSATSSQGPSLWDMVILEMLQNEEDGGGIGIHIAWGGLACVMILYTN